MSGLSEKRWPDFEVIVKPDEHDGYAILSITHNGFQWQSITLYNYDEIFTLISSLESYLKGKGGRR